MAEGQRRESQRSHLSILPYRRLGAMESNVFTIIGNQMKGGRACWSIDGGNNLARLLRLRHTGKLHNTLDRLTKWVLPEKYSEEVTVRMTAGKAPKCDGRALNPYVRAHLPPLRATNSCVKSAETGARLNDTFQDFRSLRHSLATAVGDAQRPLQGTAKSYNLSNDGGA